VVSNNQRRISLADVTPSGAGLPNRCIFPGVEHPKRGRDGFTSYMAGYDAALADWRQLLDALADLVIFSNFVAHIDARKNDGKGKAKGGTRRVLYTTRTAAFDAKNRLGQPEQLDGGHNATEAWGGFAAAMQAGKQQSAPPADTRPEETIIPS
jgi:hypothetical protein